MTLQQRIEQLEEDLKNYPERATTIELMLKVARIGLNAKPVILTNKDFRKPTSDEIFQETVQESLLE